MRGPVGSEGKVVCSCYPVGSGDETPRKLLPQPEDRLGARGGGSRHPDPFSPSLTPAPSVSTTFYPTAVGVGGATPGRHGPEGSSSLRKLLIKSPSRTSRASRCQRSTQNQSMEMVSRHIWVTAVSAPGAWLPTTPARQAWQHHGGMGRVMPWADVRADAPVGP